MQKIELLKITLQIYDRKSQCCVVSTEKAGLFKNADIIVNLHPLIWTVIWSQLFVKVLNAAAQELLIASWLEAFITSNHYLMLMLSSDNNNNKNVPAPFLRVQPYWDTT